MKDIDKIVSVFVILLVLIIIVMTLINQKKEWDEFDRFELFIAKHSCSIVGKVDSPKKTGWLCDDGITYWHD